MQERKKRKRTREKREERDREVATSTQHNVVQSNQCKTYCGTALLQSAHQVADATRLYYLHALSGWEHRGAVSCTTQDTEEKRNQKQGTIPHTIHGQIHEDGGSIGAGA